MTKKSTKKIVESAPIVHGYKAFDKDLCCGPEKETRIQYEIGVPTKFEGQLELCQSGLHFCLTLNDCFNYYEFQSSKTRICEVEAIGVSDQHEEDSKRVCRQITPIRELNWNDIFSRVNTGRDNTGRGNSGDRNSGDRNSGDINSGNINSGDINSGDSNSGNRNSGDSNSGDRNSGNRNSGDRNSGFSNSGFSNSGDFNKCDHETGYFNSYNSAMIRVFNQPCEKSKWDGANKPRFFYRVQQTEWIIWSQMSDQEKADHPTAESTDGYLKHYTYQEAWANAWKQATDQDKQLLRLLPNFDPIVFKAITGIDVEN